jgi:hypothetical protein
MIAKETARRVIISASFILLLIVLLVGYIIFSITFTGACGESESFTATCPQNRSLEQMKGAKIQVKTAPKSGIKTMINPIAVLNTEPELDTELDDSTDFSAYFSSRSMLFA